MTRSHPDRKRGQALGAGVAAMLALAGTLVLWLTGRADAGRLVLGAAGSVVLVVVAFAVVAAGTYVVHARPAAAPGARLALALVISLINAVVGVVAVVLVFQREDSSDLGVALLLAVALMAANLVAGQITRAVRAG